MKYTEAVVAITTASMYFHLELEMAYGDDGYFGTSAALEAILYSIP